MKIIEVKFRNISKIEQRWVLQNTALKIDGLNIYLLYIGYIEKGGVNNILVRKIKVFHDESFHITDEKSRILNRSDEINVRKLQLLCVGVKFEQSVIHVTQVELKVLHVQLG